MRLTAARRGAGYHLLAGHSRGRGPLIHYTGTGFSHRSRTWHGGVQATGLAPGEVLETCLAPWRGPSYMSRSLAGVLFGGDHRYSVFLYPAIVLSHFLQACNLAIFSPPTLNCPGLTPPLHTLPTHHLLSASQPLHNQPTTDQPSDQAQNKDNDWAVR